MTHRRFWLAALLLLAALFSLANRGAYKGYFQDDDLDNLSFTREIHLSDFLIPLVYPRVYPNNFRPVGHLFYRIMGRAAGLNYTPYILFIHTVHLLNVVLLWLVLRRLGLAQLAAGAGALFFAFHMAAFDVFWKPMYVFDLLCGLFCLLSLLAYLDRRSILSLLAMFIAYRSKEVAIALPVVLAAYEFLLGEKRWKRLIPFFGLSLVIGIQAIIQNSVREESAYILHIDPASVWTCVRFYGSRMFLIPYAGVLFLALTVLARDRRVWFGLAAFGAFLTPMLLLPGRLFSPYLYVPLLGLSAAMAALAAKQRPAMIAIFFALWLPWNYVNLRRQRSTVLADVRDRRTFVRELTDFNHANPAILAYLYDGGPVNGYGSNAVVKLANPVGAPIRFALVESDDLREVLRAPSLAILGWDAQKHELHTVVKTPQTKDLSYLKMSRDTPLWQLEQGWYGFEGAYRWSKPEAAARLHRPEDAREFELVVNISPEYMDKVKRNHVAVALNGSVVGEQEFTRSGWQTVRWDVPRAPAGPVEVEIKVDPPFEAGRTLGVAVGGFGFTGGTHATP